MCRHECILHISMCTVPAGRVPPPNSLIFRPQKVHQPLVSLALVATGCHVSCHYSRWAEWSGTSSSERTESVIHSKVTTAVLCLFI